MVNVILALAFVLVVVVGASLIRNKMYAKKEKKTVVGDPVDQEKPSFLEPQQSVYSTLYVNDESLNLAPETRVVIPEPEPTPAAKKAAVKKTPVKKSPAVPDKVKKPTKKAK
jgi:hypothetical protein